MAEMTLGPAFWALAALSVAAAIAYGAVFLARPPSLLRALVKTMFMAAAAAALVAAEAPLLLLVAIVASAFGDFFLAFDKKWILPLGIASFLIAQLAYLGIFALSAMTPTDLTPVMARFIAVGALSTATIAVLLWLAPKLGWMSLGVVPYAIAITAMAAAAMWLPWLAWPAMVGAASFLVSDLVLAAELFRMAPDSPVRRITAPVVWWSYAAAQALIVWGVLILAST